MSGPGIGGAAGPGGRAAPERDDKTLMRAHVNGDPDAFSELARRHRNRLWAVAMHTLGDREEAADAVQEALISAFVHANSYRGEAAVTTWLHRVVVNACIDRVRRRQARPTVPLGETEVAVRRDDHAATEARLDVHSALARLPESQRAAIELIDLMDLSVAEAAEILGVAEGTVKSRCFRGRTELARLLRDRLPEPTAGRRAPGSGARRAGRNLDAIADVAPPGTWVSDSSGPETIGGAR
ncbi:MAG TPA: RNA polymerase sigma factor SigM [Kineosporiaceae bacterium]|nr:RNA polymerase sigma factor SigM [Kineosporiaceae bacterium]